MFNPPSGYSTSLFFASFAKAVETTFWGSCRINDLATQAQYAYTGQLDPLSSPGSFYSLIFGTNYSFPSLLIPISFGIAILRYRLYDIDTIINRALVYGSLTALLALLYFGLIFTLQSLLQGLFKPNNGVVIVVSTLAVIALFQPLRKGLQNFIDRRFYRQKYNASKILATFSTSLREEVDLIQLHEHLIAVVEESMHPTHVSLWLRPPPQNRK